MSEQLENELSKQPKRRKNDAITTIAFLDHPQHAGFDRLAVENVQPFADIHGL
jgi:hypothetical protein